MTKLDLSKSIAAHKQLKARIPAGVHYSFRMPWEAKQISFARASRSRIWDIDGNEHLDLFAKFGANILGHNNPHYNQALRDVLDTVASTNLGTLDYDAAELVCQCVPGAELVRFSLSGTEAVQNALRLARGYTGRNRFVRFLGHYHGSADNVMGGKVGDLDDPVPIEFEGDFSDTGGKARGILQQQSNLLPWNDSAALREVLERHPDEVAAVLMEPICINGGGLMPAAGFLETVRQLCDQYGVVLIFDEVITGFRVGLGGAQAQFGVTPDIMTLGKALAGGALPVSAIAGSAKLMRHYENRKVSHGGTFNGYQLGLAAVKATLEILTADGAQLYASMNAKMTQIVAALLRQAEHHGIDLQVSGPPSCSVFNARPLSDDQSLSPKAKFINRYVAKMTGEAMMENGVLLSNLNRLYGNITLDDSDVELFEQRAKSAFQTVRAHIDTL